jgi:hypothetical protein
MSTFHEDNLREELKLSKGESDLIDAAETGNTSQINKTRIYADIYITKNVREAINQLIRSNEALERSNDTHSRAMNWLTGALIFFAALQVVVEILI